MKYKEKDKRQNKKQYKRKPPGTGSCCTGALPYKLTPWAGCRSKRDPSSDGIWMVGVLGWARIPHRNSPGETGPRSHAAIRR